MPVLIVTRPASSPRASDAFITRFISTCRSCVASPSTGGSDGSSWYWNVVPLATVIRSNCPVSSTRLFRSTSSMMNWPRPLYASICRASSAARCADVCTSCRCSRIGESGGSSSSARLAFPRIPTSKLLKSWAMPPASTARLSSFCVSLSASSVRFTSVRSRTMPVNNRRPSTSASPTARYMGNLVPSRRNPSTSRPIPMILFCPVSL